MQSEDKIKSKNNKMKLNIGWMLTETDRLQEKRGNKKKLQNKYCSSLVFLGFQGLWLTWAKLDLLFLKSAIPWLCLWDSS